MGHWWVKKSRPPLQESDAGYVQSPKANDNGARKVSSHIYPLPAGRCGV